MSNHSVIARSTSKTSIALFIGACFATGVAAQSVPIPKAKPDYRANSPQTTGDESGFQTIAGTATPSAVAAASAQASGDRAAKKRLNRHVVDQAGILDGESEYLLTKALADFKGQRKVQVVLMTTSSLQGFSIDDYTSAVSRQWNIASKAQEPGILVVLAPKEKMVKIHVGPGLKSWMSDELADHIIAAFMIPHFRAGDWQKGMINGSAGIISVLGRDQPLTEADVAKVIAEFEARNVAQANAKVGAQANGQPTDQVGNEAARLNTAAGATQTQSRQALLNARQVGREVTDRADTAIRPEQKPASLGTMIIWPLLAVLLALLAGAFFFLKGRKIATLTDGHEDDAETQDTAVAAS